jgi:hypothetical protein
MSVHKIVTDLWHSLEESDSAPLDMDRLISAVERCAEALELIAAKDEAVERLSYLQPRDPRWERNPFLTYPGPPPADPRAQVRMTNIQVPVALDAPVQLDDPLTWRGIGDAPITPRNPAGAPHRPPEDGPEPDPEGPLTGLDVPF